ncbi:TPA: phage holin [Staphylococcus aureus]|uniref:phage holin n=1 Tax=Staphylococcus aureus TaxID=1280 RepID=UPI0002CBED97|nr:phage holin [Staphylococcus aureus]AWQ89030.1 holin, phage phi LC3 family [Staphylococcus aureus]ENK06514.1 phage phi LC3 family holin [Staphylococcus aureus M0408]MBG3796060.1 phage holin [Staphylococcus aureus]MBU4937052.1 phage holin [Staphylococcus aureus]MCC0913456.1 phage holin [Staphylococcus aureus]
MDINWKLRFKNKAVLTGLVGALLLFIKQITDLFGLDLSTQLNQASAIIGAILTLLTGIGVITDPTSKGVSDSSIAQTYQEPRDSNKEEQQVTWKSSQDSSLTPELSAKAPKEYDTSQPFTDASNDVGFDVNEYHHGGGDNASKIN